jgi:hypothetical protein
MSTIAGVVSKGRSKRPERRSRRRDAGVTSVLKAVPAAGRRGATIESQAAISCDLTESAMDLISRALLLCGFVLLGVLLFTPYEAWLESAVAFLIVGTVVLGFVMYPRKEIFYVRTWVQPTISRGREHDFIAVKVQLARLWLLFVPTALSMASLVLLAAGGPFSFLNWVSLSRFGFLAGFWVYPPLLVLVLLSAWISERRVMRDAEACSARSFKIQPAGSGWFGRVSYLFMGEHGEYFGGDCTYFGLYHPRELARIVFYNSRNPELNKIAMGFLFHRFVVLGRGVTDLDQETVVAQKALVEAESES